MLDQNLRNEQKKVSSPTDRNSSYFKCVRQDSTLQLPRSIYLTFFSELTKVRTQAALQGNACQSPPLNKHFSNQILFHKKRPKKQNTQPDRCLYLLDAKNQTVPFQHWRWEGVSISPGTVTRALLPQKHPPALPWQKPGLCPAAANLALWLAPSTCRLLSV